MMVGENVYTHGNSAMSADDTSVSFESEKTIGLTNCSGFYVRMFNGLGEKKYVGVAQMPRNESGISVTTKHEEFSLYNKKGVEKCVIIFPRNRYLNNKNFDEDNLKRNFKVEWEGELECRITYLKQSHDVWIYIFGFVIVCVIILIQALM